MRFTRGDGLLENVLSARRAAQADRLIIHELRSGAVLDIGCGAYPFFLMNTRFVDKYGIDPAAESGPEAGAVKIYHSLLEKHSRLPFSDGSLSVIVSLGTLEHFDDETLQNMLREALRVLCSAGQLIVTTPHPATDQLLRALAAFRLISPREIQDARYIRSSKDLIDRLMKAGFIRRHISCGEFEYGLNRWFCARKVNVHGA